MSGRSFREWLNEASTRLFVVGGGLLGLAIVFLVLAFLVFR
jgi:hypothetical protein